MGRVGTLTRDEVRVLLSELGEPRVPTKAPWLRVRNVALAVFMVEAGLRVGELVRLLIGDVLFNNEPVMTLRVRAEITKTGKERMVPVSVVLLHQIVRMRDLVWGPVGAGIGDYCFYWRYGRERLSTRSVQTIISEAAVRGIGRPVNPHMLRHTFATELMRVTSARVVQDLLGHADLRSTQIYTHPDARDLARAIEAKGQGGGL